jgi:hypothetical protein
MKIEHLPLSITDWSKLSSVGVRGETGKAFSRKLDEGNVRIRIVEYSAHYKADHWCSKGHIVLVMEGDLSVELEDGRMYDLRGDMSVQIGDKVAAHRVYSNNGARVVICKRINLRLVILVNL